MLELLVTESLCRWEEVRADLDEQSDALTCHKFWSDTNRFYDDIAFFALSAPGQDDKSQKAMTT